MGLIRCNLGKFLVVPTSDAKRLHSCKGARDPSSEIWNYLSRRLSSNFAEKTASTPFRDLFLDLQTSWYPLFNKNQLTWNFVSPELEVTWRTVDIIIRIVLVSHVCEFVAFLYLPFITIKRAVYILTKDANTFA